MNCQNIIRGLCLILSPLPVWPQPPVLTLAPLLAEALARNPEVLAAQSRYEAARQRPDQAASLPDPVFSLGYAANGSPRPFAGLGVEPTSNAGFMLSQELPFPGKRKLRGEVAQREAEAGRQDWLQAQLSVVARVKQAFHELHHAWEVIELMERQRELLRKFLRITEARYAAGRAAQQDVLQAQTQLSILEIRIGKMEQEKRSREAELNALRSSPPDAPLGRPEPAPSRRLPIGLEELTRQAREHSPLLAREEKMIQRAELAVNLARKDYYPDYTVSAGYFHMGRMPDMYQLRVDFKLPAQFWRKQRAGVAEQVHQLGAARHSLVAAGQALMFRIRDEHLIAESSARLMEIYTTTVLPQASLALESAIPAYEAGRVEFLTLLTGFLTVLDYQEKFHEEMLRYQVALARLEEMTGIPLTEASQ